MIDVCERDGESTNHLFSHCPVAVNISHLLLFDVHCVISKMISQLGICHVLCLARGTCQGIFPFSKATPDSSFFLFPFLDFVESLMPS